MIKYGVCNYGLSNNNNIILKDYTSLHIAAWDNIIRSLQLGNTSWLLQIEILAQCAK